MTKLVNSLEKGLSKKKNNVNTDELKQNIANVISQATNTLVTKFNNEEISLDVKDIKDLATVYSMLSQDMNDGATSGTPAISDKASEFYDSKLKSNKNVIDISDKLSELNNDDINKLVEERDNIKNNENSKKAGV